jgi:uncharacterized membrane protein YjjP (DUF1212 family)
MHHPEPDAAGHRIEHDFLVRAATLLNAYGTPSHRLERVLVHLAGVLGVHASFYSTPTSVMASFGKGAAERVHLARVEPGEVNLGKLVEFDEVLEDVEHGRLDCARGLQRLETLAAAPPRHGRLQVASAFAVASAGAALLFGGGPAEILGSALLGGIVFLLAVLLSSRPGSDGTVEPIAAFFAALVASLVARLALPLDDRLVTLASLIVLLPGLTLTTGMIELSTRHLVAGTARLARAGVLFLTLLLGVALAWRVAAAVAPEPLARGPLTPLPDWTQLAVLVPLPLAFAVLFDARRREWPIIFAASVLGSLTTRYGAAAFGVEVAPFLGALAVGVVGNAYARTADRPALVAITPGLLVLVPGSLGYRSLTSFLEQGVVEGMDGAFRTGFVAISLVCGLLAANLVLPPRRIL